jgi:lambda family phage portal protein
VARSEFYWQSQAINQPFEALDPQQKLPRPPNVGPNQTIQSAPIFLGMARKLYRDDAKVRKGLRSIAGKVVGKGPLPCPRFPELQEIIRAWLPQADARGRDSWAGLLKRIYLTERVDGELVIRLRRRFMSDGLVLPLQLQLLETDHLPVTWTWPIGAKGPNRIVQAIELDALDRPAAYWLYRIHPHDWVMQATDPQNASQAMIPERIPASEILHFANPLRASSLRADSTIIPMLVTAHNLNSWDQAEQARKLVGALFAGYIKRLPGEQGGNVIGEEEDPDAVDRAIKQLVLEPGILAELPAGMDIEWSNPPDTGQSFEPYTRWKHMYLASCCDVSYEDFTGDWRGANDRTWRASEVQTRTFVDGERDRIERQVLQPLYRALVKLAIEMGLWAPPPGTPPHHIFDCRWTWPGSKNPNEYQEWNAFALAVQNGFMSRDEAIEATGGDPVEVDRRNAEGLTRAKKFGLNYATYLPPAGAPAAGMGHNGGPALDDDEETGPGGATGQAAPATNPFQTMIEQLVEKALMDRLAPLVANAGGDQQVPADADGASE